MHRPGNPFDLFNAPELDINIESIRVGKEVQVDDKFANLEKFAIYTVLATGDGRLFLEGKDGSPFFLDEYLAENGGSSGCLAYMHEPGVVAAELEVALNTRTIIETVRPFHIFADSDGINEFLHEGLGHMDAVTLAALAIALSR